MSTGLATLQPGGSITGSIRLPDLSSGKCWNPECDHYLSWSSHAVGVVNGCIQMSESVMATDCPYCGWENGAPPTDPKWMKKRWPARYGFELRERLHGRPKPELPTIEDADTSGWFARLLKPLNRAVREVACDHDWVEVGEKWWEGGSGWMSYYRLPETVCDNVICDKCGKLDVKREKNMYSMVGGGFTSEPRAYYFNGGDNQLHIPVAKHPQWTSQAERDRMYHAHPLCIKPAIAKSTGK